MPFPEGAAGRRGKFGPHGRLSTLLPQLTPAAVSNPSDFSVEAIPQCTFGAVVRGTSLAGSDLDDPKAWEKLQAAFRVPRGWI